jgi:hypothetical protein
MGLFRTSLLVVLSCAVMSVQAANFNTKKTPIVSETINFFVPQDVLNDFRKASDQQKSRFCRAKNNALDLVEAYALGQVDIPTKIFGYNSRMDNGEVVPGARETDLFVLRFSEVVTDAWAFNDESKKEILLEALTTWAKGDGLLKTKSCTKNGMLSQGCTEWTQSDGQDLSDSKDFSTVQMWVMKLANGYFFALADFKPQDPKHKIVQDWLSKFFERNKKASNVYFGLDHGWHYPAILDYLRNRKSPDNLIKKLLKDLDNQVYSDGSMKNRTTRGNKALWYHHDAVKEAMVTSEIARRFGVDIPPSLDQRLVRAGEVFVNGYFDHSSMDKWAKKAHNAIYEPGKQDFKNQLNRMPNGHSWFYIFSYRNPLAQLTAKLDELILQDKNNAAKDGQIGFGMGCIYASAKLGQNN